MSWIPAKKSIKKYWKGIDTVIKTVWYWWRDRHIDQRKRRENPERDHTNRRHLFLTKEKKQLNGKETGFVLGAIGRPLG